MKRKTHKEFVQELKLKNSNVIVLGTYLNCSTKIEVKCLKCGNVWNATPNSLSSGHGCPMCANNQKKTHQHFVNEMQQYNPYIEILGEYKNAKTPLEVRCSICGNEWLSKPSRLLNGAQCQNCIKPHTSFMEQFMLIAFRESIGKELVESRNTTEIGQELDIYIPEYKLAIEPGTWLYHERKVNNVDLEKRKKCKEAGIRIITIYDSYPINTPPPYETDCYIFSGFLNEYGYKRMINLLKEIMNSIGVKYNDLNWNKIANKAYAECHYNAHENFIKELAKVSPYIEVLEEYKGTNMPIEVNDISCAHPSWKARPYTLLKGIGCPLCGRTTASKTRTRTHQEFKEEMNRINPQIELVGKYIKVTERLEVRCKKCGYIWEPLCYSLLSGKGCPHCSAIEAARKRKNKLVSKTTEQFCIEIEKINPTIKIIGEYVNNKTKILVECSNCKKQWYVVPASLLNGHGCPDCARKKRSKIKK